MPTFNRIVKLIVISSLWLMESNVPALIHPVFAAMIHEIRVSNHTDALQSTFSATMQMSPLIKHTDTLSKSLVSVRLRSTSIGLISKKPMTAFTITPVSNNTLDSPMVIMNHYHSNAEQDDATFWQRASTDLYLMAQTSTPPSTTNGSSLLNLDPFESVHLFAYARNKDVPQSSVIWIVNSPDAHVMTDVANWEQDRYQVTEGDFVASEPGVYTIQADVGGNFSVPLVLVVGLSKLAAQPFSVSPTQIGIQPLSSHLPTVSPTTRSGMTYAIYPAQANWIPISGKTALDVAMMNVILNGTNGQRWSYRLPVHHGYFSSEVESPFTGVVNVTLFPHYFQEMTDAAENKTGYIWPNSTYTVIVGGNSLDSYSTALLASAFRDYNISPNFFAMASKILENSPTMETAIAAIANYSSSAITYNLKEINTVNYVWQDVATAWQSQSGICTDYSNLSAALLESVGIPTQTIEGAANGNWITPSNSDISPDEAHQWDQAWDGSHWIVFDPTWNTDDFSPVPDYLTNEFFTNTQSMEATHLIGALQIGTDFAKNK